MRYKVALDAMGGDHGAAVVVAAAIDVIEERPAVDLILVGDQEELLRTLESHRAAPSERLRIRHASQRVEMTDLPAHALRGKKDSSMRVAIDLVKEGQAQACVSAGNTGALMATARFVLRTLPGVDRPAIVSPIPCARGHTHLLDLGANVDATPRQLFEFAVMGSELVSAVDSIPHPRVGLLNVGEEQMKGNLRVKESAALLARSDLNYIGFVEGDDIYTGAADVIVCDGFVGNVALKASEGVANMIKGALREEFSRNPLTKLVAFAAQPILNAIRDKFDPRRYNGASLVGLRGIVVKSHGSADRLAFANAIKQAVAAIEKNIPERISEHLETALGQREAV